jgi:phage-related protein
MAVRRLEINGHSLNQLYVTGDFIIPSFNVETEIQEVKGRPGAIKRRRNIKPYTFDIEVIYSNRDNSLTGKEILDKVVDFVNHGDDEARIRITDQDFFWYGYIDGPIEMPTLVNGYAEFTLTIVLTDPYKYSNAIYKNTAIADSVDVVNEGTAATDFTIEATALEPSTMFMVSKGVEDYFMIGQPEDALKATVNASPYVIKDHMTNIVPWTTIQTGRIDDIVTGGTVKGRFDTGGQGSNFRAFDYGQPDNNREWHGPGIMRSLSDTVEDFSAIAKIKLFDRGTGVGKGFVHLVDEAGKLVCSFGLLDGHQSYSRVRFVVRLYDAYGTPTQILDYPGASSAAYKDDFIFCKVVRRGEVFELYTWKNFKDENGRIRIGSRYNTTFTDKDHKFQQPIRQIYLYAATYSRYDTLPVYFDYLGLVNLKGADDDETPLILQPGDVVNVDSKSNVVTINDEPRTDLKDFASNYFSLEPGLSTLLVEPQETFDTTIRWFDKYL